MEEVRVISADKDGADRRRERRKNRYYVQCDGTADDVEINDAIQSVGGKQFLGLGAAWERIFGRRG